MLPLVIACSHACQVMTPVLVAPSDDATDVPLDAEIKVRWDGFVDAADPATALELLVVNGAAATVGATVEPQAGGWSTAITLHPAAPLAPSTTYQVRKTADGTSIGYFTTGTTSLGAVTPDAPIDNPYLLAVADTRACGENDLPACCQVASVDDVEFHPGVMGGPTTRTFTIREGTQVIASSLSGLERNGMVECTPNTYFDCGFDFDQRYAWIIPPGPHTFTVVAVDLAGNESAPVTSSIDATCGALPAIDAGPDAGAETEAGGGCTAGGDATLTPALALLLLVRRRSAT